jgi:hypothetical protein
MPNIFSYKEMHIKTTLGLSISPNQICHDQETNNNKYWQGFREKRTLLHFGGNVS